MNKEQLVKEMLQELSSINRDITALRARLESGLTDDNQILINYKVLRQAIVLKDELIYMLAEQCEAEIGLVKLWQTIQQAN